jgi:predicted dehydrogenase
LYPLKSLASYIVIMHESQSKIKFAIIGTGLIGPRHAAAVQQDPNAVLTCIVDPSPNAKAVAETLKVPIYGSVQEMLSSAETPNAAIVCTPNHTHVAVSIELLNGGVHVLVEKPISIDPETGRKLASFVIILKSLVILTIAQVEFAKSKNLKLLVAHHRRFNRYIVSAKSILSSETLDMGHILAISGLWTLYKPPEYFQPPTEWRRQKDSGGPILINLIHEIDLLHYLIGPIVRVQAERGPDSVTVRGLEHKAESGVAITLRFASGAVGTFLLTDNTPSPFNFESGTGENPTIPQTGLDFYRIFCSNGVLSVPDMRIWRYETGKGVSKSWTEHLSEERIKVPEVKTPFELQVAHLIRVIKGEEEPSCSGDDGLRALRVCHAVKEAIEKGSAVSVEVSEL